jgi:hypothetical protein
MKNMKIALGAGLLSVLALLGGSIAGASAEARGGGLGTYRVTLINLTEGQPLSPPVALTHRNNLSVFEVGEEASDEIAAIAQDGNQSPGFSAFDGAPGVTDVVDVGTPLTPFGKQVGDFTFISQFEIEATRSDRLSLATMLICTNDGFTGVDGVRLPRQGSKVYLANAYDAGRELNTEASSDIVDPCSGLGPAPLAGDPNGNENVAVESDPREPIAHHPGISGDGDLDEEAHGWDEPVMLVIVQRIG